MQLQPRYLTSGSHCVHPWPPPSFKGNALDKRVTDIDSQVVATPEADIDNALKLPEEEVTEAAAAISAEPAAAAIPGNRSAVRTRLICFRQKTRCLKKKSQNPLLLRFQQNPLL